MVEAVAASAAAVADTDDGSLVVVVVSLPFILGCMSPPGLDDALMESSLSAPVVASSFWRELNDII